MGEFFKPSGFKFHSGGREDIDVRMVGNGRPFVLEMLNPKKRFDITEAHLQLLADKVNEHDYVNVTNLHFTDKTCFEHLTNAAETKVKAYCAVIKVSKVDAELTAKLNASEDIVIKQMTPLRVLHRRTLMIRDKMIHMTRVHWLNDHYGICYLLTSAGTYVKEFVHGDLKRTRPNIGSLLECEADILQLDVLHLYEEYNEKAKRHFIDMAEKYSDNFKL